MVGNSIDAVVEYIIRFLLGSENEECVHNVSYGIHVQSKVNIVPSDFFNSNTYLKFDSLPKEPLNVIDGTVLLYGEPRIEKAGNALIVRADIIASTFFLITRYEEYINREARDEHGRFPATASLPYRAGFLERPIVDEYGRLLRKWLRMVGIDCTEPKQRIETVYLTHDLDVPWSHASSLLRCCASSIKNAVIRHQSPVLPIKKYLWPDRFDNTYMALNWLSQTDNEFAKQMDGIRCTSIFFLLCCSNGQHDFGYSQSTRRTKKMAKELSERAQLGIHISYAASLNPTKIEAEAKKYAKLFGERPKVCRYHYLACREPEDLKWLIQSGIQDDFTHAYADMVGFRLGTCRPVRWIDPVAFEITPLTLHPMTVMECTLDMSKYMSLNEEDAYVECCKLIHQVKEHHGEIVLLWHNTSVTIDNIGYQRSLYQRILKYIMNLDK